MAPTSQGWCAYQSLAFCSDQRPAVSGAAWARGDEGGGEQKGEATEGEHGTGHSEFLGGGLGARDRTTIQQPGCKRLHQRRSQERCGRYWARSKGLAWGSR